VAQQEVLVGRKDLAPLVVEVAGAVALVVVVLILGVGVLVKVWGLRKAV
jgi:hypothetical protein